MSRLLEAVPSTVLLALLLYGDITGKFRYVPKSERRWLHTCPICGHRHSGRRPPHAA